MPSTVIVKIQEARRRLNAQRFLRTFVASLTGCFAAGALVLLAARLFSLPAETWLVLAIGFSVGLIGAIAWTWRTRHDDLSAAIALDHAFHLKERVSTLLSLGEEAETHPAGLALAADVEKRAEKMAVGEKIPVRLPRRAWVPALPLAAAILIGVFVGPTPWFQQANAKAPSQQDRERIVEQATVLEKKLAERKQELADGKLDEELAALTTKIEKATKEIAGDKDLTPKEAVLKLSDLAKTVEEKQKELNAVDQIRRSLNKLSDPGEGPAKDLADALKKGDFKEAAKQLRELEKKLQDKDLDAAEKEKLAKQLDKMKDQLQKMSDLGERAEQLAKSLPPEMLKQELDKLKQDAERMKQLKELAEKLGECSKCLGKDSADGKELEQAMAGAQQALDEMLKDEQSKQMLEKMLDDMAECRGGMCEGNKESQRVRITKNGTGKGRGAGEREEAADETKGRESRAPSEIHPGQSFVVGRTKGNSFRGDSKIEIREAAAAAVRAADDAVTRQKVPREYKEHTREYFEKLNGQLKE
ncbi:MAG: hypothetical protein U1D30_22885 [Planctomycetota bacterium]